MLSKSSFVYQCSGCETITLQPLARRHENQTRLVHFGVSDNQNSVASFYQINCLV